MHKHKWMQDRSKTPRLEREALQEPIVCQGCGATGHQVNQRGQLLTISVERQHRTGSNNSTAHAGR